MATSKKTTEPKATPITAVEDDLEVTPVSAWKAKRDDRQKLPSGKVMRLRNVGFQAFIKAGIIPNSLMATVDKAVNTGEEPSIDDLQNEDTDLTEMFELVDEVMIFVAIEPEVHRVPMRGGSDGKKVEVPMSERDPDKLYVDEIDDQDKMFVFGITTGGTRDVEQFRSEQANSMASVQRSEGVVS
jgi:hypothetical protein